jgi:hypothetical protein
MSQSSADSAARRHQLCDVLLAYLQDSEVHLWPELAAEAAAFFAEQEALLPLG